MVYEYDPTIFENLSKSEEELVDLLSKHQKDFGEMETLKTFMKKLYFPNLHMDDVIKKIEESEIK